MMSSSTEPTSTKMKERPTESNKNSRNIKKMSTPWKENNKKTKKEMVELSSDSDTNFSPKNTTNQSKTNTKQKKTNIVSDDESSSDSRKRRKPNLKLKKPQKKPTIEKSQRNKPLSRQRILQREDSTSSEKEFSKHKILESYVCLHRISDIEKDRTPAVSENKLDEDKHLTKNEAFLLKNNLQKLFQDLQSISTKLIYEIEHTRKTYYYKDQLRFSDATKAIIECKSILRNLKEKTNNCEKLLVDRYNNWCKKTNNKNLFINNDGLVSPKRWKTPTINGTKKVVSTSSSDSDSEGEFRVQQEKSTKNLDYKSPNNERKSPTQVSDCDGHEIFSADEMEIETPAMNLEKTIIDPVIKKSTEIQLPEKNEKKEKKGEDVDSSDSDTSIGEKELTTSIASDNPKIEKIAKTNRESELNESRDLFTDSDEDKEDDPPSNDDRKKTDNNSSNSESSIKCSKSNSNENDAQRQGSNTPPSTRLEPSEKSSDSSSEEENTTEKQLKERLLNSSPDSNRNELKDKDVNIKQKLLESSSDSDENEVEDENTNIKKGPLDLLSSSEETELRNEDINTKKKLLDSSSSDSDQDEVKNNDINVKEKSQDSSSTFYDNVSTNNQSKSSLNLSISSVQDSTQNNCTPKETDLLSNLTEIPSSNKKINEDSMLITSDSDVNTSDEDEVKKKLLDDSSSDSDQDKEKDTPNNDVDKNSNKTHNSNIADNNINEETEEKETKNNDNDSQVTKKNEKPKIDTCLSNKNIENPQFKEVKQKSTKILDNDSKADNSNTESDKESMNNTRDQEKTLNSSDTSSDSENTEISKSNNNNKVKNKFSIKNNKYYQTDQKLRMKCFIKIQQLSENILSQHSHTLRSSREYLETKQFHSLISLEQLEKKHHHGSNSTGNDEEDVARSKLKKKQVNLPEETLLDHLNKVDSKENNDQNFDSDNSDTEVTSKRMNNVSFSEDLIKESDAMCKAQLLETSDSDLEIVPENDLLNSSNDKSEKKKTVTEKKSSNATNNDDNEDDKQSENQDESKSKKSDKNNWKKSKVLTAKFFESDSEEENERAQKKLARTNSKKDDSDSDKSGYEAMEKKKKTKRRRLVTSDDSDIKISSCSSDADSETEQNDKCKKKSDKKNTKRRKKSDSDSDAVQETAVKTKRRRIRTVVNDSDSSDNEYNSSQTSATKGSGRKNIRKVLKDKQVAFDTQKAAEQEEERLKRMAERQKLFNEMYETRLANEEKVDKLILDFDNESKEILLDVDKNLVKRLKPHQAKGIKFMWDACFESLERVKSNSGSGCILAHCMGLGKSFQVVTLAHTLLTHSEKTDINTILIVAPLSTVLNWMNEFKIWLAEVENGDDIELYEMTKARTLLERKCQLENWQRTGGILIIGYEMFRNLSSIKGKVRQSVRDAISKCIINPGPDLIVCDEGHLLKNEDSAISKAIRQVRTLRRIVLTGTPLQNNLIEYHCMVQFVKPNLLGTKKEFSNRFVNPIQNGQFDDSTEYDVKIMKRRAHVLHKMLEGSVQRFDYSVLTPFLPPKQEYVILVTLTDVQRQMYQYYLDNFARQHARAGGSLFVDFQGLHRIWTHPYVMKLHAENNEKIMMKKREAASDSEGSLRDFINDDSDSDSSSNKSDDSNNSDVIALDDNNKPIKRSTRANPLKEDTPPPLPEEESIEQREWWSQFVKPEHYTDIRVSVKLLILFDILKEADQIGDKVLVFSQSLYSLTLIEKFLEMIDDETQNSNELPNLGNHTGSWSLGLDYFRLDGQTSAENRSIWVKNFNKPSNTRARLFLISTRAGGLGINLTAANRVVIFDASWNPSHDVQSIFRIYRFGQKKPCYVYRLLAAGTMEEKIYNRQVTKLSLSCRVVDEYQIERHYSNHDLAELYRLEPPRLISLGLPKDRLLAEIFLRHKGLVEAFHEHDSLLENIAEEELNEEERKQAWQEYEEEKAGRKQMTQMAANFNPQIMLYNNQMMDKMNMNLVQQGEHRELLEMIRKDYPHLSDTAQREMAYRALNNMYHYFENQFAVQAANKVNLPTMNVPNIPNISTSKPSMTVANMLAQQEYTRAHNKHNQQQKQMQYAQQFGNTIGITQNKARPTTSTGKYSTNNGEIIDIAGNSKENPEKRQEE